MFAFRLCLQLGYPHPDILLRTISSSMLSEWMAYAAIEPFGEFRSELRHGKMMHLLDQAHFKRDTPLRTVDFMHFIDPPEAPPEPTLDEIIAATDRALGV